MTETTNTEGLASIAKKKAAIMGELTQFAKDKRNQKQGYDYPSAASIFDRIRALMAKHGLVLFTSAFEGEQHEMQSKSGTAGLHTIVRYRMLWVCTDTGGTLEDTWIAEGDDYQDKGYSKCATLALKYYLLTSFVVSSGDDADDGDSGIGSQDAARRAANAPKTAQNAPKTRATPDAAVNGHENGNSPKNARNDRPVQSDPYIAAGTTETVLLTKVNIEDKDGRRRLRFTCNDGMTALAWSRELFRERGWIDENEWGAVGFVKLQNAIPATATYRHVVDEHGEIKGGYWEVTAVSEVVF